MASKKYFKGRGQTTQLQYIITKIYGEHQQDSNTILHKNIGFEGEMQAKGQEIAAL